MKAVCPENAQHKRFVAFAATRKRWLVSPDGTLVRELEEEGTDLIKEDPWYCFTCGAEVIPTYD